MMPKAESMSCSSDPQLHIILTWEVETILLMMESLPDPISIIYYYICLDEATSSPGLAFEV